MPLRMCTRAAPRPSERLTPSMLTASPANKRPEMSFMGSTGSAKVTASSARNATPQGTDAVIVELGANDMLRGIDPQVTHDALDAILARLSQRHIAVMLCGMRAAPNLGADYVGAFERIYPELAAKYGAVFYPFF